MKRQKLKDFYLEYFNDFITIDYMAEYYQLPKDRCFRMIMIGRKLYNQTYN